MKIMFYALRPFDERAYCEPYSKQYGIDYAYTAEMCIRDSAGADHTHRHTGDVAAHLAA